MVRLQPPPSDVRSFNAPEWQRWFLDTQQFIGVDVAPADAPFLTFTATSPLTNAQNIGLLATGFLQTTTALGVATISSIPTIPTSSLSGTLLATQFPALTGDATTTAGSLAVTVVRAPAGTLTGTTLAAGVTVSSLVSFGTSPALTGTPTAPTAAPGTNTTQIATTAFVSAAAAAGVTSITGTSGQIVASAATGAVTLSAGANVPLLDAANVFTANQAITYASAAAGNVQHLIHNNTSTGSAQLAIGNNAGTFVAEYIAYGSTHATKAAQVWLGSTANYPLIFETNGTRRGTFFETGGFSWGDTTDPGATNVRVAGTLLTLGATVLSSTLAVTSTVTISSDIAWANNTGFGLVGSDGVRFLSYTTAGGVSIGSLAAKISLGVPVQLAGYTVATLPAGTQGFLAYATDLLAPAFLAIAVGGGAIKGPVFYNGTNWVAI